MIIILSSVTQVPIQNIFIYGARTAHSVTREIFGLLKILFIFLIMKFRAVMIDTGPMREFSS